MTRLRANMRAADLHPAPSELNLVEASAAEPAALRDTLLGTLQRFAADWPLLEWPFKLLQTISLAMLGGLTQIPVESTGLEAFLEDPRLVDGLREECSDFGRRVEATYAELHANARPVVQARLKAVGVRRGADTVGHFLTHEWPGLDLHREFARATWRALSLPGEVRMDLVRESTAWSLLLDAEGLGVYFGAIVHEQPRAVQRKDLLQLIYLGLTPRRVLATADEPFYEAAQRIVRGRYPGARIVRIAEMLT